MTDIIAENATGARQLSHMLRARGKAHRDNGKPDLARHSFNIATAAKRLADELSQLALEEETNNASHS